MEFQKITNTNTCKLVKGQDVSKVIIPEEFEGMLVVEIEAYAFARFEKIETIMLPKEVKKIGQGAFSGCKKLKNINIPKNVQLIPEGCFSMCSSLESIPFHDEITTIETGAFFNCGFTKIVLPLKLTEVEEEAFAACTVLEEVVLPPTLKRIGKEAFAYCSELKKINFPNSLEVIEKDAFDSSYDIKIDYLPNDFIIIDEDAFVSSINLPLEVDPAFFKLKGSKDNGNYSKKSKSSKNASINVENFSNLDKFIQIQSEALGTLYNWLIRQKISNISVGEIYHSNFEEHSVGPYIFYYDDKRNLTFFRLPLIVDYTEKNIPYLKFDQGYFDEAIEERFVVDYKELKSSASRLFVQSDQNLADKTAKFFSKKNHEKPSSLTKTYFYEYVFLNDPRYETMLSNWELCRQIFLVPNAEQYQGFSHLIKQHSSGSIQHKFDKDDLPMIGTINIISYSLVFNTLSMLENEKSNKKKPLRNTSSNTPKELIENPFLWTKLSVAERSKLDNKVLYPDTENIENYDLGNDFYGLGGDDAADALSDFGSVSSSMTYDDAIAEDNEMLEMEMTPIYRTGLLLLVYLLNNERPDPSMYKYFQKYCYPKLKTPKDHEKYLSDLEDNIEGRFRFLVYLIALHPKEVFENQLQLPDLFADYPQD